MTRIYKCNYCGIEDTAAADEFRLQKCTGCNSSTKLYCSRECQKLDWPSHKHRCRRKANDADMLVLHDEKVPNLDRLLMYASRYMGNLKHVKLRLTEFHKVGNNTNVSTDILRSFLKSKVEQLDSLTFDWEMDLRTGILYKKSIAVFTSLTNGGNILTELHGLKLLDMLHPIFNNCNELIKVINQQQKTIQALDLVAIQFGYRNRGTRNDWSHIASSISKCRNLVRLNLNQNLLRDSDMEVLLSSLQNLKILLLCGPLNGKGGHLTDKTCKVISKTCPGLKEIDLVYHEKITFAGIKRVLKSCQHLVSIRLSMVLSQTDVMSMHNLAPNLIYMSMRFGFDDECFSELLEAMHGHVVLNDYDDVSDRTSWGLSDKTSMQLEQTQIILDEYHKNAENPKVIDDWEFVGTFKNKV